MLRNVARGAVVEFMSTEARTALQADGDHIPNVGNMIKAAYEVCKIDASQIGRWDPLTSGFRYGTM